MALLRAFLDPKLDKFVAWNSRFRKAPRISEQEIQAVNASEILFFGATADPQRACNAGCHCGE
jgi:hypothetical protein